MAEFARVLAMIILAVAFAACGYVFRGWQDGTLIARSEADVIAQARVDEAAMWAVQINTAQTEKQAALRRVTAAPRVISMDCPPGSGAVSADAIERLREASK